MGGTLVPSQMYDHTLVPVKGAIAPRRLDFAAAPKTAEEIAEGMCCSLDSNGEFVKGCPVGALGNKPMPIFVINGQDDFDTNSDKGNISGGVMSGLVGTGAFEVESTEYKTAQTFAPNDLLKSDDGDLELLSTLPYEEDTVVGVVSKGVSTNRDGISILSFWTVYLPAGSDETASESSSSDSSSSESSDSSDSSSSASNSSSSEGA